MKKAIALILALCILVSLAGCSLFRRPEPKVGLFWANTLDNVGSVRTILEEMLNTSQISNVSRNADDDAARQLRQITEAVEQGCNLLAVNLADSADTQILQQILDVAGEIPVVFFGSYGLGGLDVSLLATHPNACFVGVEAGADGRTMGKQIGEYVLKNYDFVDRNGDAVVTYAMLSGDQSRTEIANRVRYAVEAADAVITGGDCIALSYFDPTNRDKCQQAAGGEGTEKLGRQFMNSNLTAYNKENGNEIELVICTGDSLTEGAAAALQAHGYEAGNLGTLPLFGYGMTDAMGKLLSSGAVVGTVEYDSKAAAEAIATLLLEAYRGTPVLNKLAELTADDRYYAYEENPDILYVNYISHSGR